MQDNINKVIANALVVKKDNLANNIKKIIESINEVIKNSKDLIEQTCEVDINNGNGTTIDMSIFDNIYKNVSKENDVYGEVTLSQKDDEKKIIYGKEIMDIGNVVVINDGNPYVIYEMALRNIMAGNTTIFSNEGYMYGTNMFIIQMIQSVLEQYNISKNLVQLYISNEFDDILSNFANIDLVICIGDSYLQKKVIAKSKNKVVTSGYDNYEIYIENDKHVQFIEKIIKTGLNVQVYIQRSVNIDYDNAIIVEDIDEAIGQINYSGSRYSVAIFTEDKENASRFIQEIKSKIVTVNTSPSIERIIDIKQSELINEKTIIYPFDYKINKSQNEIEI